MRLITLPANLDKPFLVFCLCVFLLSSCYRQAAYHTAGITPAYSESTTAAARPTATAAPSRIPSLTPSRTTSPTAAATVIRTAAPTPSPAAGSGSPLVIGTSAGGRPLEVYRFGTGADRRMVVAGIHGGYESNTVALADQLVAYLQENAAGAAAECCAVRRASVPLDAANTKPLVPVGVTLYILRVLNPDGYAHGAEPTGRTNANGVDLNRNWNAFWQADWQRAECWSLAPVTAGARPASEPETQALGKFLLDHSIVALISYHSAMATIFAGGRPPAAASMKLAVSLANASGYRFPPAPSTCEKTGQFIDWASARGIAAVDVELTNHAETDFAINLKVLKAFLNWKK